LFAQGDKGSDISTESECRRAVWTFQGEYATKAGHLFKGELDQLKKVDTVHINISPFKLELSCGYEMYSSDNLKIFLLLTK